MARDAVGRFRRIVRRGRICALLVMLAAMPAQAGTATANLGVQITVAAACTISAATLNFGGGVAGNLLIASTVAASTTASVTCTSGSAYSIGLDNGQNPLLTQRRLKSGASFLAYQLYLDAGNTIPWTTALDAVTCTILGNCYLGTGTGSSQTINIYGLVLALGTAPPTGTYTDTITMTISY